MEDAGTQVQEQQTGDQGQTTGDQQGQQSQQQGKLGQGQPEPKHTDDDVNKYKGTAREEGRTSALNKLLKDTGAESVDALLEGYSSWTEAQEEARTDLERAEQARQQAEQRDQEKDQALASLRKEYALRDALRGAEINPERLNLALKVADTDSLEISEDKVTADSLETVVGTLTESSPEWFGNAGANGGQDIGRPSGPASGQKAALDFTNMSQAEFDQLQARVRAGEVVQP